MAGSAGVARRGAAETCGADVRDEIAFSVDEEGAFLFAEFELESVLARHAKDGVDHFQRAARYYLSLGTVSYPHAKRHLLDRTFRQGQYVASMGLAEASAVDG